MQLTDPANLQWVDGVPHRATAINLKMLVEQDGVQLTLSEIHDTTTRSPRHRHNFDQIRIGLEGVGTYGRGREIRERMIGYFPEGTRYGPQGVTRVPNTQAVLQFEGASGSRYLAAAVADESTATLRRTGQFRNGLYFAHGAQRGVDAFQAVWEHAVGRAMVYPAPRYEDPVYLYVDAFAYLPTGTPGVAKKVLGVFGERELSLRMVRLRRDAEVVVGDARQRCISFVLGGTVQVGPDRLGQWSAIYTDPDERAVVAAPDGEVELVEIVLPLRAEPGRRRATATTGGVCAAVTV
ncbi:MAG TPA: hypothetical protein VMD28_03315 [Acidimicrobiales bacterium]|nr:hypothetical protein [Acidimicrobiales bacterium]